MLMPNTLIPVRSVCGQSFEQDGWRKDSDRGQIRKAAGAIIDALSKARNSTVMLALLKVELVVGQQAVGESRGPKGNVRSWM